MSKHQPVLALDLTKLTPQTEVDQISYFNFDLFTKPEIENAVNYISRFTLDKESLENPEQLGYLATRFVQPIMYVALRFEGKLLAYPRSGTETQLHDNWSVGFGGHIDLMDLANSVATNGSFTLAEVLRENCIRELHEEIGLYLDNFKPLMVIHDKSNQVGLRHLAFMHVVDIDETQYKAIKPSDECKDLKWLSIEECGLFNMESWSKILINKLT